MVFKKDFGKVFAICTILTVSASGCDLITSIKEYFQEPAKQEIAKTPASEGVSIKTIVQEPVRPTMTPDTLARVGNWTITVSEFEQRLSALKEVAPEYDVTTPEVRKLVLDELINQQILVAGAEKTQLANQEDIRAAVDEFRRTLIVREVARQLTENITMSDEEARAFYAANEEELIGPSEWHVREIVVESKEEATNLLTDILKGADFEAMARLHSKGMTAAQGGDLGFITQEPFAQMGSALLSLEEGDVSSVFKGPEGYYIVKLEEKKEGAKISFEEIKDDIVESQTLVKQQQAIMEHLTKLKEQIKIDINEQLLNP